MNSYLELALTVLVVPLIVIEMVLLWQFMDSKVFVRWLDSIPTKKKSNQIETMIYKYTGFKGDDAHDLVGLLLRYHYYGDRSKATINRLRGYGLQIEEAD